MKSGGLLASQGGWAIVGRFWSLHAVLPQSMWTTWEWKLERSEQDMFPPVQFWKDSLRKKTRVGKTQAGPLETNVPGGLVRQLRDKPEAKMAVTRIVGQGS